MTGPEHYHQAQQFLLQSAEAWRKGEYAQAEWLQDGAQVHATLALAAATAEPIVQAYTGGEDTKVARGWTQVTS